VLNATNEYKLQLPVEVGLADVPAGSAATYLEYIEGKKYPLAYFDNFEVAEKLTEAQKAALEGKFLEPQTSRMISNGTGVLEIINTDKRQAAVNATVEKIWNDMGADHSGDQIRVKFVQSLYQLTEEQLEAIAEGNIPEGTYTGEDIQSNKDVKVIVKGKTKAFILDSNISSISSASSIATINHNSDQLIITGDTAGTETITVAFSDGTEQELTITVIEPEVLLDETGSWTASWNGLPSADDSGSDYYYYAVEEEVPEGYIASYVNRTSSGTFRTTITNTQPTELKIVKKWYDVLGDEIVTDPDDADYNAAKLNKLPDSITVEIYQLLASQAGGTKLAMPADADINSILIGTPYRICTLEKADGFSKILKDLPKTNDQNEEYVYYFKEVGTHVLNSAEGYYNLSEPEYRYISEVKYQNNGLVATENGIVTISNKLKPAKIKFIKTWADGNENHDGEQVTIRVYRSTIADTEEAQQNPLILSLDKNPVTMTKSDTSGVTVTANQKVKIISAEGEDYDNTLINVATDGVAGRILNITPTGTKTGTTTIKLQSEDGQIVELIVNVTDDPALMLTADKSTFKYDETPAVLTATYTAPGATPEDVTNKSSIGYTSSNTDVIEVAADGTLTVNGVGDATITATYKGLQDSVTLTVELPDTFNVIGEDTVNMGDTLDLDVDPPFGTFEWSSSDETVATVDDNGVVTPVGEGTANITATRNDGEEASKEITVNASKKMPFIFETSGDQEISRGELSYTYDQETGIITLNIPAVEDGGTEYRKYLINAIQTNDELKNLKPLKYEVYPETGQNNAIGISAPGIDWKENHSTINAANPTVFDASGSAALSSKPVLIQVNNVQGPYVIKIQVAGGAEPQPTDYIQTMDSNGGKYRIADYIPAGSQVVFKLKDVTGSGAAWASAKFNVGGNNNNQWTNLNNGSGYEFNLDENGEKTYTITVDRDLTDAELQMWYYSGTASNLQLVSCEVVEAPAPNGAPRRRSAAPGTESGMPLTRFSASTLRLGKAKAYAASAPSEISETGSADSGQKSMMSTPQRSAGTPTFEDDGYIEKTISSSDDWQLIANDLPMYNVKADGTVEPYYYWVEEVGGADGYKASYLFIDGDEHTEYSVNASTGTTPEITIQNTPDDTGVELPETGGKGMKTIYMAGGVMILLAIAGGLKVRKRIKNV
jgi:LPXTG-motif cell wall-anchored protein